MSEIRSVSVHLDADVAGYIAKMRLAGAETDRAFSRSERGITSTNTALTNTERELGRVSAAERKLGTDVDNTSRKLDNNAKASGRAGRALQLLIHAAVALGPALVPIGAAGVAGVEGLASAFGFAVIGAGTFTLAMHGVGDALKAFNKAALAPTTENIAAAQKAMDALPPSAQLFVLQLHKLGPELTKLRQAAGEDLFPGLTSGLHDLVRDSPLVQSALRGIGGELGGLARDAGRSLSSDQWRPFIRFVGREAPLALDTMGHATGDVIHGLAQLWMAFTPINHQMGDGILRLAQDFDRWATSLGATKGFQDFLAYVATNGPRVLALLGDVGSLFTDIVRAAAPLGGPTLQALDLIVKALDALASSPLGTPILLLIQLNSVLKLMSAGMRAIGVDSAIGFGGVTTGAAKSTGALATLRAEAVSAGTALRTIGGNVGRNAAGGTPLLAGVNNAGLANLAKGAALAGGLALIMSGLDQKVGLTNTTMLTLAGSMVGPVGAAIGGAVGLTLDLAKADDATVAATRRLQSAMKGLDFAEQAAALEAVNQQVDTFNKGQDQFASFNVTNEGGPLASLQQFASGVNELFTHSHEEAAQAAADAQLVADSTKTALGSIFEGLNGADGGMSMVLTTQQLTQVAERAQPAMDALGISVKDLQDAAAAGDGSLGRITGRIVDYINQADSAAGKSQAVSKAFADMADNALTTDQRVQGLTDALDALIDPMLELGQAKDAFHQGLNDLNKSLDHGSKSLKGYSDAAITNRNAIRTQVSNLKTWIEAQAKAGVAPEKMTAALKDGRQAIIDEGRAAGLNADQVRHMIDVMGLTPKQIKTTIALLGAQQANSQISGLRSQLEGLDGRVFRSTVVVTRYGTSNLTATGGHVVNTNADGGTIPGQRRPYGDRVLHLLAPGEEVISNRYGQADRHRGLLKRINAGRGGAGFGMADGGTVTTTGDPAHLHPFAQAIDGATGNLHDLNKELAAETRAVAKERQQRDALVAARQQLVSTVSTNFRSDLFGVSGAPSGVWAKGASDFEDPTKILHQDIRDAREYQEDIRRLRHRGLSKAALTQVTTLEAANQLEDDSRRELRNFSRLYGIRQRASQAAGATLGDIRYSKQIAESNQHLRHLRDAVHHTNQEIKETNHRLAELHKEQQKAAQKTGDAVAAGVNKAASVAVRRRRGDKP